MNSSLTITRWGRVQRGSSFYCIKSERQTDLIVTKSVSRFARNIIDCIGYVRQLKSAEPPIGVFFETENIFTLDENSEMSLSFIATLAQEESHTKSEIMNSSIEMRFKRGIFLTPKLLGYDHDDDGNLIINEDEAKTVRLIFFSYLYGYSSQQIADALTSLERLTKKGNSFWSSGTVLQILSNERYCGDVLARKTFTPNYLNHKSKKNNHERNQYRQKQHHEGIITREDFFAVQKLIRNAKYGNKGYFPEMHVVSTGFLKGYVVIHPKWAGFSEQDYMLASISVFEDVVKIPSKPLEARFGKGTVDLSGYEVVRSQFMSQSGRIIMTLSHSRILFNKASVARMPDAKKIELLVFPGKRMIAVRNAQGNSRFSIEWRKSGKKGLEPKLISGAAFIPTLYRMFSWNQNTQYKITGIVHRCRDDFVLLFCADDAVLSLDRSELDVDENAVGKQKDPDGAGRRRKITAFPKEWADSFGEKYCEACAREQSGEIDAVPEVVGNVETAYAVDERNVTSREQAADEIKTILGEMGADDGY